MSRARRQQYMLRTEASEQEPLSRTEITASLPKWWEARSRKCSSSEKAGSKGRSSRSASPGTKREVRIFVHRNEIRRRKTAKGTEGILKTGSRLWKLRCYLLQPRDRIKGD